MSTTITRLITADELLAMPDDGYRYELVKGELFRMPPPGAEHGAVTMNVAGPLYQHAKSNRLGVVYAAETGFQLEANPDTVRAPDVAFVTTARVREVGITKGYWVGAPDLAVEVMSPSDRLRKVEEKAKYWLDTGARMVWVVNPKSRTVTVYHSPVRSFVLAEHDTLDGGDVVPGFRIAVAEIFDV